MEAQVYAVIKLTKGLVHTETTSTGQSIVEGGYSSSAVFVTQHKQLDRHPLE